MERHGRIWVHDGHTPALQGVLVAAILHAHDTIEVHPAVQAPTDVKKPIENPRFPGQAYPEFISFSGGVCTTLRSFRTVGRYLKIVHGKGTGGPDTFMKGLRQMEGYSICLLLASPVDTFYKGYSAIDPTTIRYFQKLPFQEKKDFMKNL